MNDQDALRIAQKLERLERERKDRCYWETRDIKLLVEEVERAKLDRSVREDD